MKNKIKLTGEQYLKIIKEVTDKAKMENVPVEAYDISIFAFDQKIEII